jgi:lysophospholipid acyltransferase (LPLAT)-like uncharacterized protein
VSAPLSIAGASGAGLVRLLAGTLRLRITGLERVEPFWRRGQPLIYVMWHGRVLLVPWLCARLGRASRVAVLTSRSRDGELVAAFARRFGLGIVRGSSSRGGAAALRALVDMVTAGTDVAVVPDGPRGPRGRLQPGVVALAGMSRAPVVPVGVGCHPATRLATWDEFVIPWPFARCQLVIGEPRYLAPGLEREQARVDLERALETVTAEADRSVRR